MNAIASNAVPSPPRSTDAEEFSRALLNILEDFGFERLQLEAAQKAMLNLLDDFDAERLRSERTSLELERLLREREVLLKEVHHRVKNNLQVVSSLLGMQGSYFEDPRVRQAMKDSQDRVFSIALVHENLYRSEDLAKVKFSDYVRSLVDHLPRPPGTGVGVSIAQNIENASITIDIAVTCGLIINELVTNALKHAFPGEGHGSINVSLRAVDPSHWMLSVADDGVGLPAGIDTESSKSLGLELVRLLTRQLAGTLEIKRNGGTCFQLTFPMEA